MPNDRSQDKNPKDSSPDKRESEKPERLAPGRRVGTDDDDEENDRSRSRSDEGRPNR